MTLKQRRYAETSGMQVRDSCAVASGCGKMPWGLENSRAPALTMAALYPKPREAEHKIARPLRLGKRRLWPAAASYSTTKQSCPVIGRGAAVQIT